MSRIATTLYTSESISTPRISVKQSLGFLQSWQESCLEGANVFLLWVGGEAKTGSETSCPNTAKIGHLRLVLDGFIYNRDKLDIAVKTNDSDAQVFLKLVEKYGFIESLSRINGDFAVICHDERDNAVWCARDRVGVRPLYYAWLSDKFLAASMPAALLAQGVPSEIDTKFAGRFAGSHYRLIDNQAQASPFAHIHQLPAGHTLRYHHGECTVRRWWIPGDAPDLACSEEELVEQYKEIFLNAVGYDLTGLTGLFLHCQVVWIRQLFLLHPGLLQATNSMLSPLCMRMQHLTSQTKYAPCWRTTSKNGLRFAWVPRRHGYC